ncbi:hypothetical protein JR316_0001751 [Psilocybe cubensis]|uniref:Uncharacterized protein n=2 Tax=Psilocybe cubensis TaxID=181762 RepID=A0ACB8HCD0_PSICU|nr:hypothetical protein JR316_0001751 [Psilocybe cubensis]KAH9484849.1 hypothetical protein JR316_0001751 [Psilocybe cubensis]
MACRHLHDYSGQSCHLQGVCDACPRLLVVDKQIEVLQNTITRLVKLRTEVKRRINYNHDSLLGRLPVEIISMIFVFCASGPLPSRTQVTTVLKPANAPMRPVMLEPGLLLGSVCRYWRHISIKTPQLWTRVAIDLSRDIGKLNLIEGWLRRSGGLPLNIILKSRYTSLPPELEPLLSLLRSQATRLATLTLSMPPNAMRDIFIRLPAPTRLHFLHIIVKDVGESPLAPIVLEHALAPTFMKVEKYCPPQTFVRWDNLRCVELESIQMDALVHIFAHGTRLDVVRAYKIKERGSTYPLPSSPIVHSGIRSLSTEACRAEDNFLQYIRLPGLASLTYDVKLDARDLQRAHNLLVNFLRHSASSLNHFRINYKVDVNYEAFPDWKDQWKALPQLTALEIDITTGEGEEDVLYLEEEMSDFIDAFFRELAYDREPVVLPNLQCLIIKTNMFAQENWILFANIIPPGEPASSSESNPIDVSTLSLDHGTMTLPVHGSKRPLKRIIVQMRVTYQSLEDYMPESLWLRFMDLQKKGLTLIVEGPDGVDLLARMAEFYDFKDVDNPYDESETSSDDSDETGTDGSHITDSEGGAEGPQDTDSDAENPLQDVDAE